MNTSKPINSLIEEFLSEADCKQSTINTYGRVLRLWVEWMVQNADIRNPTKSDIIRYKNYLIRTREVTTVDLYIASLKLFFKWLKLHNIHDNVADGIHKARKYTGHRRKSLSLPQVLQLLSSMETTTLIQKRNFAIINLMSRTGLRCVEIVTLNVNDLVKREAGYLLKVQRKGRNEKDGSVHMTDSIVNPIQDYLNERGNALPTDSLFARCGQCAGKRISTQTIGHVVTTALSLIGIKDKNITAHSLRHSAAMVAVHGGALPFDIQKMLGHSNLNTTMIYLHEWELESMEATAAINTLDRILNSASKQ